MRSLLVMVVVGAGLPAFVGAADRSAERDDVREAAFRHMFQHNASGLKDKAGVYCLAFGTRLDPGPAFLARFAGSKPPVKGVSECESSMTGGVADRVTRERGLIFHVDQIRWKSDTEAEIDGGYYEAGLSSSGNTYYLKKRDGRWTVVKDVMHWIS
jgi:hypothetical protein